MNAAFRRAAEAALAAHAPLLRHCMDGSGRPFEVFVNPDPDAGVRPEEHAPCLLLEAAGLSIDPAAGEVRQAVAVLAVLAVADESRNRLRTRALPASDRGRALEILIHDREPEEQVQEFLDLALSALALRLGRAEIEVDHLPPRPPVYMALARAVFVQPLSARSPGR